MKITSKFTYIAAMLVLCAGSAHGAETFRYGTVAIKGDAGFVYMGTQPGITKKYGADIDLQAFQGDAILLKALIAGQIDAYIGNPGGPMIAASKGANIKIVGCPWPGLTYALYTKSDVGSVADLRGKTIGVSAPGALPDLFAKAVVMSAGMTASDVKFTVSGSDAERVAAVAAGVTAAAPSSSEFTAKAASLGLKQLVHARDIVPKYIRFCIMTRGDLLKSEPGRVEAFLAAQIDGFSKALNDKKAMTELSFEKANLPKDDPSPELIYNEVTQYNAVDPTMAVNVENLAWMRDLLVKTGNIKGDFDPATMVDTAVLTKARALASSKQ
ncbi:PhnD/SsuA/transferrin family substrate-binding protein [Agrobacterium vitis]|uniref:ABC transporter substrate-binding protein n=1 Tax=Agrobacterium vitis TaxID=373 RepID=A0AAE2UTX8_AGRVI|nr:ABC transporter substrate-binding protein [Agrobacterium vitis]MBF2714095.1 ABC transporter substrate-binding protein [Agrobacterium vitis]MUO82404.1 PhnD/SsuA/transferrin family substrate-binding protein [Agrobacterium vitis]MUO95879.1 PhnD/SsuA/transferrin family substrate-binding protein [Agrobacterium vitis]MVA93958.1 PhnD/SsuA/transferrin family substrate-binding protein [Agrobacterium vitis]MVB03535.1 PhnD/SsuA/transferrin family substrate-binding protein [Agrobacterium vitis]